MHMPPRIVVAEDDEEMRRLIAATLRKDGFDVTEVSDGMRLLVHVIGRGTDPEGTLDLIISDFRMPATTGLEVLRRLRKSGWNVPFILCTAFGDEATREHAEELGAVYLEKPFEIDDLRKAVHDVLLPKADHRGQG
jgi:two-component system response regulator AtoC